MTDFAKVERNLKQRGYTVKSFADGQEAAAYLNCVIDGTTVGIGVSATIEKTGVYELLKTHNTVYWHWNSHDFRV